MITNAWAVVLAPRLTLKHGLQLVYWLRCFGMDLRLTEHSGLGDWRSKSIEMRLTWAAAAAAAVLHNALAAAAAGSDRSTLGRQASVAIRYTIRTQLLHLRPHFFTQERRLISRPPHQHWKEAHAKMVGWTRPEPWSKSTFRQ